MDHHQVWLEQHGFYCAALRCTLTPKACADNRDKPAWGEEGYTTSHYRPTPCCTCTDWQRLCAVSAGKEEDMGAKKQGKCAKCGEVKTIAARGLCWTCYEKKEPDSLDENRRPQGQEEIQTHHRQPKPDTLLIEVDFSLAPDVHKQLVELAKDEVRDLDKQIIWLLKNLFRKAQLVGGGL